MFSAKRYNLFIEILNENGFSKSKTKGVVFKLGEIKLGEIIRVQWFWERIFAY